MLNRAHMHASIHSVHQTVACLLTCCGESLPRKLKLLERFDEEIVHMKNKIQPAQTCGRECRYITAPSECSPLLNS